MKRLVMDRRKLKPLAAMVIAAVALTPLARAETPASSLDAGFRDPPNSARPRVWWHWMNGNVTEDGIRKDLEYP